MDLIVKHGEKRWQKSRVVAMHASRVATKLAVRKRRPGWHIGGGTFMAQIRMTTTHLRRKEAFLYDALCHKKPVFASFRDALTQCVIVRILLLTADGGLSTLNT